MSIIVYECLGCGFVWEEDAPLDAPEQDRCVWCGSMGCGPRPHCDSAQYPEGPAQGELFNLGGVT